MFLSPGSRARARPFRSAQPTKSITGAYAVAVQDYGAELILGGGSMFTVTLGPPSNYPPGFWVTMTNVDSRGKRITPFSGTPTFILWPVQSVTIYIGNTGSWRASPPGQRYRLTASTTFNVSPTQGVDTNDGLATGTGAFATIAAAVNNVYQNVDMAGQAVTISVAAGATITESVGVFGNPVGYHVISLQGASSASFFTWNPSSSTAGTCVEIGDNAQFIMGNVTFSASNNSNANYCHVLGHQWGVIEFGNVTFGSAGNTGQGVDVLNDSLTHVNFITGATLSGSRNNHVYLTNGHLDYNGTMTLSSNFVGAQMFALQGVSYGILEGNVTFVGSSFAAGRQYAVTGNSVLVNLSGSSIPGTTAGVTTTGGQYATSVI